MCDSIADVLALGKPKPTPEPERRAAKEIAAEIGEELIAVKQKLAHGEFMPWVEANCSFKRQAAQDYMKVASAKYQSAGNFKRCNSIADVLALGKPKPEPQPERSHAYRYITAFEVSVSRVGHFEAANSIREVLEIKDTKPAPEPERRAATIDA